jgi:hypothetical protein
LPAQLGGPWRDLPSPCCRRCGFGTCTVLAERDRPALGSEQGGECGRLFDTQGDGLTGVPPLGLDHDPWAVHTTPLLAPASGPNLPPPAAEVGPTADGTSPLRGFCGTRCHGVGGGSMGPRSTACTSPRAGAIGLRRARWHPGGAAVTAAQRFESRAHTSWSQPACSNREPVTGYCAVTLREEATLREGFDEPLPETGRSGRAIEGSDDSAVIRTFLIADVRGYTVFTQERGDEDAAKLASKFASIAREGVEAHGGKVVELRGMRPWPSSARPVRRSGPRSTCRTGLPTRR